MKYQSILLILLIINLFGCQSGQKSETNKNETLQIATMDNSRTSLDWSGIYRGKIPCADCDGILTEIELNSDLSYHISRKYSGKSDEIYSRSGVFKWDDSGSRITLEGENDQMEHNQYLVGENQLIRLDVEGNTIQGELSNMYILLKIPSDLIITDKYWKLIELAGEKIGTPDNQYKEAHFILQYIDNRVTGIGGCNTFHGMYELTDRNRIKFSKMASTMMACADIDFEKDYLQVFEIVDNFTINGDTLSLNKARMAPLAKFKFEFFK